MRFNLSDNPVMRGLGRLCDLMILNILFIICSIPIFTMGASITALYSVLLKMVKNEEGYIFKGFLKAFKDNFKRSTILWLIYLAAVIIIVIDIRIAFVINIPVLQNILLVIFSLAGVMTFFIGLYLFPMSARYENTIRGTIKNSLLISVGRLPYTILLGVIHIAPIFIILLSAETFVIGITLFFFVGFAVVAMLSSMVLRKVFVIMDPKDELDDPDKIQAAPPR